MHRATGGTDDPGGPGAEQDVGHVRRRSGRLPAKRCCANTPAVADANYQAVGGALLGGALGAGLGAGIGAAAGNAGKGAAIGAASGGALGIIGNADGAPYPQESLQQQYDIMYGQCMAAHGNSVASLSPPPGAAPYSGKFSTYSGGPSP